MLQTHWRGSARVHIDLVFVDRLKLALVDGGDVVVRYYGHVIGLRRVVVGVARQKVVTQERRSRALIRARVLAPRHLVWRRACIIIRRAKLLVSSWQIERGARRIEL